MTKLPIKVRVPFPELSLPIYELLKVVYNAEWNGGPSSESRSAYVYNLSYYVHENRCITRIRKDTSNYEAYFKGHRYTEICPYTLLGNKKLGRLLL